MLNWNLIDNDKIFQRLTNHLFALECDSPGFIPSSPYIGADGGWDGYYKGYYQLEKDSGVFSVQSKWTKKSFDEAGEYLKTVVKEELKKAKDNKVNHLRISTNAELRIEHVLELQSINKGDVETLEIWSRENLEMRIIRYPYLRFLFFKEYPYPALVDSGYYYNSFEREIIPSTIERPALNECKRSISGFLGSKDQKIFHLYAHGGQGKSHLLRDLSLFVRGIDRERQIWFVRAGFANIEALQSEISSDKKYLLIVDDADRYVEELRPLLHFLKESGVDVKVIFATRSSGVYIIIQVVQEMKCFQYMQEFQIKEWNKEELTELLRLVVGKNPVEDEEQIVHYNSNPYLIVWIGNKLKGTKIADFVTLRKKFIEDIIVDTKKCLAGFADIDFELFIFTLTCIVPFHIGDKNILENLTTNFEVKLELISGAIERLIKVGILRKVGNSVRFNTDMKGDIYLGYKLEFLEETFLRGIILHWITITPNNVFSNIGSASRYGEINKVKVCLSEIALKWEQDAAITPLSERRQHLKFIEDVATLIPEESMRLLRSYKKIIAPEEENPYLKSSRYELSTDDYGPVLLRLMAVSTAREQVLSFIYDISGLVKKGSYSNYHIETLISQFVCPISNDLENILSGLLLMETWMKDDKPRGVELLKSGLNEVLAGTHEYTHSYMDKFVFGERYLKNSPQVIAMRDKAIEILYKMLDDDSLSVRQNALQVVRHIGHRAMSLGKPSSEFPLYPRIIEETRAAVEKVGTIISKTKDFKLLSAIEDMFVRFWATKREGAENVAKYLRIIPRTPEYLIFRAFAAEEFIIDDFSEVESNAPEDKRWEWFVHNGRLDRWNRKEEDFENIVQQLNSKYRDPVSIVDFLVDLGKLIVNSQSWSGVIFLNCWVKINPKAFKEIRNNDLFWSNITEMFQNQIDYTLVNIQEGHLLRLANEIFASLSSVSYNKISNFLWLIDKAINNVPWQDWIIRLIQDGKQEWYPGIIRNLYFISKQTGNFDECIEFIIMMISKTSDPAKEFTDAVDFFVHSLKNDIKVESPKTKEFRVKIIEMLKKSLKFEWHEQDLLKFCITDVDELLIFVENRFELQKQLSGEDRFYVIPFEGITALREVIHSYDDYTKFIKRVIKWEKEEKYGHLYLKGLVKTVVDIIDKGSGANYHVAFIRELLGQKDVQNALYCMEFLTLSKENQEIFIGIGEEAIKLNLENEVKTLFFHKTYPEDGWSAPVGQVPPVLLELKDTFESLYLKAKSASLKDIIKKCSESIGVIIKEHLDRDEEMRN
ncbi:MAG: hypothetical protein WCY09_01800 [Candidatus Omnitrophota bacterium]